MTTSTTDLTLTFENTAITAFNANTDNPTFPASPIAKKLNYASAKDMLRNLEEDEKGRHIVPTLGGPQEMAVITLPGLMHALSNRRPGAIKDPETRAMVTRFQRWVNHEVLPTILRTGRYVPDAQPDIDPQSVQRLLEDNRRLLDAVIASNRLLAQVAAAQTATPTKAKVSANVALETTVNPDTCTLAERWYLAQIKHHGYAVAKECPFPDPAPAHKRMMQRFALVSKPKRIPRDGYTAKQTTRVIVPTSLTPTM